MSNGVQRESSDALFLTLSRYKDDQGKVVAILYDQYAGMVLGFLEKMVNDHQKAESLLQAVFLALGTEIQKYDPGKGRLGAWILRFARSVAHSTMNEINLPTNGAIRQSPQTVSESSAGRLTPSVEKQVSVIELLYVKGYTFATVAEMLGMEQSAVKKLLRKELNTYRSAKSVMNKANPDA